MTLAMLYDPNDWVAAVDEALGLAKRRVRADLDHFKQSIEGQGHETGGWRGDVVS